MFLYVLPYAIEVTVTLLSIQIFKVLLSKKHFRNLVLKLIGIIHYENIYIYI